MKSPLRRAAFATALLGLHAAVDVARRGGSPGTARGSIRTTATFAAGTTGRCSSGSRATRTRGSIRSPTCRRIRLCRPKSWRQTSTCLPRRWRSTARAVGTPTARCSRSRTGFRGHRAPSIERRPLISADRLAREFSRFWNGTYRRPWDLTTLDGQVAQRTGRLWLAVDTRIRTRTHGRHSSSPRHRLERAAQRDSAPLRSSWRPCD